MYLLEQPAFNFSDHYTLQIKSFQGKNKYQRKDIEKILSCRERAQILELSLNSPPIVHLLVV